MSGLRKLKIFDNMGLKFLALLLALLSWMAIQEITSFEQRFMDIPVRVKHDIGMSVQDTNPQMLHVRLRGTRSEILALNERDLLVEIDLQGQPFEENVLVEVTDKQVIFPGSARLLDVDPPTVHIRMDQSISRRAALVPQTQGSLPEGYTLESITTVPEWVTLRGSRRLVGAVERVQTEVIDLSAQLQSFEIRVPLLPPSPNWPARMEPQSVLVRVDIAESFVERVIEGVPLHVLRASGDFSSLQLSDTTVAITVKGNPDVVAPLVVDDLQAYIRAGKLFVGKEAARKVVIDIPTRVRLVSIEPSEVMIRQRPQPFEEISQEKENIPNEE